MSESVQKSKESGRDTEELMFMVKGLQSTNSSSAQIIDMLEILEGLAPFLDKTKVIELKCKNCDNYAPCFFPLEDDYDVIDTHAYCHKKGQPLHHLTFLSIAKCRDFSRKAQMELADLAKRLMEELRSALRNMKIYDHNEFANYPIAFELSQDSDRVTIQLGHMSEDGAFVMGDARVLLVRRPDPRLGNKASQIGRALHDSDLVILVEASRSAMKHLRLKDTVGKIAASHGIPVIYDP
ncbi:MAG: hypothetical protein N3G75_03580 [Methanothrix sp.]|nr:hypothetical protein [Methanothrix sp.]MCX8206894.1 hypothetical protein [Methanothrix sp.]